ncbi:pitrilysin family protein [Novosphingobium sp. H3SJ31-1]|uniref:Pitrilysin family protein n=2 Tax=Novosphingobium album (ex Liu et al. 2023) TaxID=3031130 RepID=A0ABT5WR17_9SPHN|nr:pitrilysin family protein [Novosphingobium album (ex Liu et al. 2023)]
MFRKILVAGLLASVPALAPSAAAKPTASITKPAVSDPLAALELDVPAKRFVLKNGLTLIVHEDKSAPLVAVNIWYHVGSKNEPKGRSGFAHLFEHLMFNGSENFNDDYFKATEKIGASDQNGTTNPDRTNYYQTVPKAALDSILWLESDRMGHLLGAIDQAKLDEQRAVVKNEKRQGENKPYAKASDLIMAATTPSEHPYGHSTIGSMEDLDAASLDDVKQWFRDYYGPSNAVIVLSGDISPEEGLAKVETYFGSFEPGTPVSQPKSWPVRMAGAVREVAYDRVAQPRLYRVWNISDYASADTDYLQFLAQVLAGDRNSRLVKRLVIDEQVATGVSAEVDNREIGGQFYIRVDLKPGADIAAAERAIGEELKKILAAGPTPAEMARVRTQNVAGFVRSMESIAGKASLLAESQTYLGSPDGWKLGWSRYKAAKPADLVRAGNAWLTGGDYVLHVLPFGQLAASGVDADRSKLPEPGATAPASFPAVERATLGNGLELVVARRTGVPVVNMTMLISTGTPADYASTTPMTGALAMGLLKDGTASRTGEQIVDELAALGASVGAGGGGEQSTVTLSAVKPTLRQALAIYADVLLHPAFRSKDVERVKEQAIAGITSARQDGASAAGRLFPSLMYGKASPYGRLATEADVASLRPADLAAFHDRWFKPNNATLIVAGDTTLAELRPLVESALAGWQRSAVPEHIVPESASAKSTVVYLFDKPGAPQSAIRAAVIAPKRADGDEIARDLFNTAFGGSFTSRINMKLREEKGWAYGASSGISGGRGSRLFVAQASVQADKTVDSMTEIATLLKDALSGKPVDAAELARAKDNMSMGLSNDWSKSNGIAQYLLDEAVAGLPEDYYAEYAARIGAAGEAGVNAAGSELLARKPLTWVIAGDLAKIEAPIRALGLGEVRVLDADGNVLR